MSRNFQHAESRVGFRTSSINDCGEIYLSTEVGFRQRKKKEPKKKETSGRGSLWKLPQPRKSFKVAFGNIFLMISTAAWKTLLGFPQLPQARRLHPLQINWRRQSLDSVTFLGEAIRWGKIIDVGQA